MKNYIYCAIIALVTISCHQTDDIEMESSHVSVPMTLNAKIAQVESRSANEYLPIMSWEGENENVESRTYAIKEENPYYGQYWSSGDAISYFTTTGNMRYVSPTRSEDDTKNYDIEKFEWDGEGEQGEPLAIDGYYYSIYPYNESTTIDESTDEITYYIPNIQYYSEDSYANGINGMIAKHDDPSKPLEFKNFCSYLKLQLLANAKNTSNKVKKIVLTANNINDQIAGLCYIDYTDDEPFTYMGFTETTNSITLDCGEGIDLNEQEPSKFWFVLPGGVEFSEGFTITVIFDNNNYYKKSKTVDDYEPIIIDRNHIQPMKALTVDNQPYITGPIIYKTTNNNKISFNDTFRDTDGNPLILIDQIQNEKGEWILCFAGNLGTIGGNSFIHPLEGTVFSPNYPDIEYIIINNHDIEGVDQPISLEPFTFYHTSAEKIIVKGNITTIGEKLILQSNITEIIFEDDVDTIEKNAFFGSSIQTITFNGGLKTIGLGAFQDCDNLVSIVLPSSLKEIGEGAFDSCDNLQTIYCYAETPPTYFSDDVKITSVFIAPTYTKIYVPSNSLNSYKKDRYWKALASKNQLYAMPEPTELNL